jgi:hypothetical protein
MKNLCNTRLDYNMLIVNQCWTVGCFCILSCHTLAAQSKCILHIHSHYFWFSFTAVLALENYIFLNIRFPLCLHCTIVVWRPHSIPFLNSDGHIPIFMDCVQLWRGHYQSSGEQRKLCAEIQLKGIALHEEICRNLSKGTVMQSKFQPRTM